jgi:uridine kinase
MTGSSLPLGPCLDSRAMHELLRSRLFWSVLALKLVVGSLFASAYMRELFSPFLRYYVESGFSDPWQHFAELDPRKFPYPPLMLYVMAPPIWLLSQFSSSVGPLDLLALRMPLLACELLLLWVLVSWFPQRTKTLLLMGWCSPLLFYVSYWHGQLDIVPTTLLLVSLYALYRGQDLLAAVGFGAMLASKLHLLIALPFIIVYLLRTLSVQRALLLGLVSVVSFAVLVLPYGTTEAFRIMVLESPEQLRALAFRLPVSTAQTLVVAPLALALLWFRFSTYTKANWDLLMMYLGIAFCVFITLAPPQPAYVLWFAPFWFYYCAKQQRARQLSWVLFNVSYFAYWALHPQSDLFEAWQGLAPKIASLGTPRAQLSVHLSEATLVLAHDVVFTGMVAALGFCVFEMYRGGVTSNDVYRARLKPVLVGLSGDSGSGKDLLARDMTSLLGDKDVVVLAGDDYHRWPRGHEMWNIYTHLDARANDLHAQMEHVVGFSQGNTVFKGTYDHDTGQFTPIEQVDPRKFVVVSGLHALANEAQRRMFDLAVFLDPDEALRRHWKVRRDCSERGYAVEQVVSNLERRSFDRGKYVLVQREVADLVVHFRPIGESPQAGPDAPPSELALEIRALNSFDLSGLASALRDVDTMFVEHHPFSDARCQELNVFGNVSAHAIAEICRNIIPNLDEVAPTPRFEPDLRGVLQAVFLACLSSRLRWSRRASDAIVPRGASISP